jgi:ATP-dependent DNA ligase
MFDLLVDRGMDVMNKPLTDRRARLEKLFRPKPPKGLLVVDALAAAGEDLFQLAVQLRLEGLAAKLAASPYLPGARSQAWRILDVKDAMGGARFGRSGGPRN